MSRRTTRRAATGLAAGGALLYVVSVFFEYRPPVVDWAHEIVPIVVPALVAIACACTAMRLTRGRAMWILFSAGAASWAAGDLTFTVLDTLGISPAGSLTFADAGYLALVPLWCIALIFFHPARHGRGLEQVGTAVDAAAAIVGAGGLAWAFVLLPIAHTASDFAGAIVALAYPIGDLALLTAFFALVVRSGVNLRSSDVGIGIGIVLFAVSDLWYARLALTDSYRTGSAVDLTFEAAFVAIAVASRRELRQDPSKGFEQRAAGPWTGVVGIVLLAGLGTIGVITRDRTVLVAAFAMGVLLTVRQTVLLVDRRRLQLRMENAIEEARRANAAKTEFLSHMSHELGNPLTAILGYAGLIAEGPADPETREQATRVQHAGQHVSDIIREALDITRIEQGRMGLSLEPLSIAEVALECVEMMQPFATTAGVAISVDGSSDRGAYVLADRQRLKQALLNLLSNAIKYNREHGSVTIGWRVVAGERQRVSVTDTGAGIPEAAIELLFRPFERLGSGGAIAGTGLGLALTKRLVEAMHGEISVESAVGSGSTFSIDLPRAAPPRWVAPPQAGTPRTLSGSLLYIEDNVVNVTLVEQLLRAHDVRISSATRVDEGLRLAKERSPDVILLDRHLPDGSAEDVLRGLRASDGTRDIPVVILSADAAEHFEPLLAAGARAGLTKPIDIPRLVTLLDQLLQERADVRAAAEEPR